MRLACILSFAAAIAASAGEKARPRLPPDMQSLVDLAMATPPEFAADALLRIATSANLRDPAAKRELIERAFQIAPRAQYATRLIAAPGAETDTRAGYLSSALRLRLDALSLQTRAITAMLSLDKTRAREMMPQLIHPAIEPLKCEDALIPDVSAYYDAVVALINGAFSDNQRAQEEHLRFALSQLSRASGVADIPGAASLLTSIGWSPPQFEALAGAIAARLAAIPPDSRAFWYYAQSIEDAMAGVVARAKQLGVGPEPLAQAYRAYLVSQLTAPRCGQRESEVRASGMRHESLPPLFGAEIRGDLPALSPEEMKPERTEGGIKIERYWQTDEAKRIFEACWKLRAGPNGAYYSEAARNTPEWNRALRDFLNLLAGWNGAAEASEADYFHEKAIVFEALLELAPPGELRDRVLENYVVFLQGSTLAGQSPVEWFWHVRATVDRLAANGAASAQLRRALERSGNVILTLEAILDEKFPRYSMFPQ
ncbi:MAG TPA: hypothetical protein VFA28_21640 [Bryobacteraceae bacterium]|nr:hypothetical protein [Bryobacteraceae bacterium]